MCRGANLGECCAQGCVERIQCRDTGGYCDEHNPFDLSNFYDDEAAEVEERPAVVDDPEKRRAYTIARLHEGVARTEASIAQDQRRLVEMRARVAGLTAADAPETSVSATEERG